MRLQAVVQCLVRSAVAILMGPEEELIELLSVSVELGLSRWRLGMSCLRLLLRLSFLLLLSVPWLAAIVLGRLRRCIGTVQNRLVTHYCSMLVRSAVAILMGPKEELIELLSVSVELGLSHKK